MTLTQPTGSAELSATFVVTADDLVAMSRMTERDAPPLIHLTTAVVLASGVLVLAWLNPTAGLLIIGVGVVLGVLSVAPAFWRFWIRQQSGRLVGEHRRFVFDEEGIHEEEAGIRFTTPWTVLSVMRVTPDGIFLLRGGVVVQMLPARAFASAGDIDRLIGLVSAQASNVRVA